MGILVCDMNCLECKFSDCINGDGLPTPEERKLQNSIDRRVVISRGLVYDPTQLKRCVPEKDLVEHIKAMNRYFHHKYYWRDPESARERGRVSYLKHREKRIAHNKVYYEEHREEILNQKKGYYAVHREEILKSRKESYTPHPREVIDTPQAQAKRERERERYQKNKEEINRKRREKRKRGKESVS